MELTHPSGVVRSLCGALLLASLVLTGCGSQRRGGVAPPPAEPPRGFPPPRDVPIDQALVAAAKQELQDLLRADMAFDRVYAIEGLRHSGGPEATGQIIDALTLNSAAVRFAAAMALGDLKVREGLSKLKGLVNDKDPRVQVAVRYALHRLGDTTRSHDLEAFALHNDPKVRGTTAMVLGRLGDPSAKGILYRLRADPDASVRQQAEEALFLLDDPRGRDAILGFTASRHPDDVMFAMRALAQKKDPSLKLYAWSKLSEANDQTKGYLDVALAAAMAMGAMQADDGYGVAMQGMTDQDPQLGTRRRALAAATFGMIGRPDAQPYLANLLKDKESQVRAAAATAILQIANDPKKFTREGKIVE